MPTLTRAATDRQDRDDGQPGDLGAPMSTEDSSPEELVTQVGPWAMVPAWVLEAGLTPGEFVIYVALRTFADRGGKAYPRPEAVAERARCSARTVHNAYGRFRQLGLMTSSRTRRDDGTHGPVRVTLRDVRPTSTAPHSAVESHRTVEGDSSTAPDSAVDDHRTTQGDSTAPHSAVKEHPTNNTTPRTQREAALRAAAPPDADTGEDVQPAEATATTNPEPAAGKRPRGTRLPPDWSPDEPLRAWTRQQNAGTPVNPHRELDQFRDYWVAKAGRDATKLDWSRTWQRWIRTAVDHAGRPAAGGNSRPAGNPYLNDLRAAHAAASTATASSHLYALPELETR
jgi:hypothetical protein